MKRFFLAFTAAAAIITGACASSQTTPNYTVTVPTQASEKGAWAYIVDYDSGLPVDSLVVSDNGQAVFSGNVAKPILARLVVGGNRGTVFVLEPGEITVDNAGRTATGSPLNDRLQKFNEAQNALAAEFHALPSDSTGAARATELQNEAIAMSERLISENADNPLGLMMLLQQIYEVDLAGLDSMIAKYPVLASSSRVAKFRESLNNKALTSEGKMFRDFSVDYDGKTEKLSDYVGKGHYTIVDFWASWCGPCIRQTKVLKELYKKYADKGLEFLGVAVWDEPANTLRAIKQHDLPWHNIINAQTIPTDLYGISGIPCIILFGPDGTIISRDKQSEELVKAVDDAMAAAAAAAPAEQPAE